MKKSYISWGVASLITIFLCTIPAGYKIISSCKNHDSQVEYASKTDEKFYQKMVKMKKESTLTFNGFPTCLTSILSHSTAPGDKILYTEKDTLYLIHRDLNIADVNRYPCYLIKDNHNNLWTLFRHNDKYILTRKDEIKNKKWLEFEWQNKPKE